MSNQEFEHEEDEVEQRLAMLHDQCSAASKDCHEDTLHRLSQEARRLAKQERRLLHYLSFGHNLFATSTVDATHLQAGLDAAIESITLLEDFSKAKEFEPDIDEAHLEYTRDWLLGSAYHTVANFTSLKTGNNSPGMHECIGEGMVISRQAGSRRNFLLFREFAVEVYMAADDLDLALHFARESILFNDNETGRKVASADDVSTILSLQGRFVEACEMTVVGFGYCEEFHNPYMAKLNFASMAREIAFVAGNHELIDFFPRILGADEESSLPVDRVLRTPDRLQNPYYDLMLSKQRSIESACHGDFKRAIEILEPWDARLYENKFLARWFIVRSRLVALYRLIGQLDRARRLAKQCEPIAKKAHDWLTLRKLERLLDESIPANPLATLGDPDCGPFAKPVQGNKQMAVTAEQREPSEPSASTSSLESSETEKPNQSQALEETTQDDVPAWARSLLEKMGAIEEEAGKTELAQELLSVEAPLISDATDAIYWFQLSRFLMDATNAKTMWERGQSLVKLFPADSNLLSLLAVMASDLHQSEHPELTALVSEEQIQDMFRRAMDLDPNNVGSFGRAGMYYLQMENFGEAERYLSRAFRLNRRSATAAINLAKVYAATERPRDALAVLDMCLREGCLEPDVAWEAAMHANNIGNHEATLTYLDHYQSVADVQPYLNYFRAYSLLELGRSQEGLEAAIRESEFNPDSLFATTLLRATAYAQLRDLENCRQSLHQVFDTPWRSVTNVTLNGLKKLCRLLWVSFSAETSPDDLDRARLESLLVQACLAPSELFEDRRLNIELQCHLPAMAVAYPPSRSSFGNVTSSCLM